MTMHKLLTWHERRDTVGGVFVDSAPPQWDKAKLQDYINDFIHRESSADFRYNADALEKETLLTLAGQLQRYGGEYYMGVAREVREYLYAHFELTTPAGTHI